MTDIIITYGDDSITMSWDGAQASAPILVDGTETQYRTADARHRTCRAVLLVARQTWPDAEWPTMPSGGAAVDTADSTEAWDDLSYEAR